MVLYPPSWVPDIGMSPPDGIPIADFMYDEKYGRHPIGQSRPSFTCGITGESYTITSVIDRSQQIAKALSKRLGWLPDHGTPWDKVLCIFSFNNLDYIPTAYAVHRLSGIVTTANAMYSADELEHQLRSSGSQALVTCYPLLSVALRAAEASGIPIQNIFVQDVAGYPHQVDKGITSINDLISEGRALPPLAALKWSKRQGARQPAFLCYSSGTSGLPKAVMVSHQNIIANVLQHTTFDSFARNRMGLEPGVVSGFLPFSHIYALVVACHTAVWRGEEVVILPKFDFHDMLRAIQRFKISQLFVVPPMIIQMLQKKDICLQYDLKSVRFVWSGAAPLGDEVMRKVEKLFPTWSLAQAYGMTETAVVVSAPSEHDIVKKTAGSLLPGFRIKLIDVAGNEVTQYDTPGEVFVQGPSVATGYLNNEKANAETFVHHDDGRWIRTGDEAVVTLAASGNEHVVIVDRIKELIKVKGHQVAPAELEAHLLTHPAVSDCAVIQTPHETSGEVPKAFIVRSSEYASKPDIETEETILRHVADHKAHYKHLKGGVEFLDEIPKSPSGKILRRVLREREKTGKRLAGPRL